MDNIPNEFINHPDAPFNLDDTDEILDVDLDIDDAPILFHEDDENL